MAKIKAYRLAWIVPESRGEVRLFTDSETNPEIRIEVGSAADLAAWDTLLSDSKMKNVASGPIISTDNKPVP